MVMSDCLFCRIVRGELPASRVYEDGAFLAFLDINPINSGHTLVIPKKHYENIFDLPDDVFSAMAPVIKKVAGAVKRGVKAEGVNLGMNNERPAGQLVPHAHMHVMPRFVGDGHEHWRSQAYAFGEAEVTLAAIKKFL